MRLLAYMISFFIIAQLLGIYTGTVILKDFNTNPYVNSLVVTQNGEDPANALLFMVYVLIGAALMILRIRTFNLSPIIFRLMEFWLIASASSVVFYSVLRIWIGFEESTIAGIAMGLLFSGIKVFQPKLKNTAA